MVGLLAFLDPPRPDSKQTIEETRGKKINIIKRKKGYLHFFFFKTEMGVSVKMITGDQLVIAKEVAHRLGLPRTILPASKLTDTSVSTEELTNR